MSQLFKTNKARHSQRRPLNLFVPRLEQTALGLKSVTYEDLCNFVQQSTIKRLIKTWERPTCNCNFCKYVKEET